jgi:hypothetical protein
MKKLLMFVVAVATVASTCLVMAPANAATNFAYTLRGRILLQVEANGEAWYVNPVDQMRCYLGRPDDAFRIMRELGLGISNADLFKIRIGQLAGQTLPTNAGPLKGVVSYSLTQRMKGRILLQVEDHGEAWYVNPVDSKRYYLGRPEDAFNAMRSLGLGISNANLNTIPVNPLYANAPATVSEEGIVVLPGSSSEFGDELSTALDELSQEFSNQLSEIQETGKNALIFTRVKDGVTYTGVSLATSNWKLLINRVNLSTDELEGMKFAMALLSELLIELQKEADMPIQLTDNIDIYLNIDASDELESMIFSFVDYNASFKLTEYNTAMLEQLSANLEDLYSLTDADAELLLDKVMAKIHEGKGFHLVDFKAIVDEIAGQDTSAAFEGIVFE